MLKHLKLLSKTIVLFIGIAGCVQAQESIQRKQLFDYNWKFYVGDAPNANTSDFDDKSWRNLDLPHDWSIEGKIILKIQQAVLAVTSRQASDGTERYSMFLLHGKVNASPFILKVFT